MKKKSHYLAAEKSASLQREKVFSRFNIHLNKTIFPRVNSETEVTKSLYSWDAIMVKYSK